MYGSLRNVQKSQNCTLNPSVHQNSSKSIEKGIKNEGITDRPTDRQQSRLAALIVAPIAA